MKTIVFNLSLVLLLLFSCDSVKFKEPEFKRITDVRVLSVNKDAIVLQANCVMYNNNPLAVDLSNLKFDVMANNHYAGEVVQTLDTKMPANAEFSFPLQFTVSPKDIWGKDGSSLLDLGLQLLANKSIDIQMDGTVKAGMKGHFVNIPFTHQQQVDLR